MSGPFCDYIGVTVPLDRGADLLAELRPVLLDAWGVPPEDDGESLAALWRFPDGGTAKFTVRAGVLCCGFSGAALASFRKEAVYATLLAALCGEPHRVTQLDIALDVAVDAAPVVREVLARGRRGEVALTRKAIKPVQVRFLDRVALYDGVTITGTAYLGERTSEAYARVYDKRNERLDAGLPDPGPLVRFEMVARGGLGISLRDAFAPAELFYHLAAPDLLTRPAGVAAWEPRGEGFELPPRVKLDPAAVIKRRLDGSLELAALLELADRAGPHGREFLLAQLRRRILPGPVGAVGGSEARSAVGPLPPRAGVA